VKAHTRLNSRKNTPRSPKRRHCMIKAYDGKCWGNVGTVLWIGKQAWLAQLIIPTVVNLGGFRSKRHALAAAQREHYTLRNARRTM